MRWEPFDEIIVEIDVSELLNRNFKQSFTAKLIGGLCKDLRS